MSTLQATVSRLMLDLEQEREKGRQGVREAAKAEQRARDLKLELSTTQASYKECMELVRHVPLPFFLPQCILELFLNSSI